MPKKLTREDKEKYILSHKEYYTKPESIGELSSYDDKELNLLYGRVRKAAWRKGVTDEIERREEFISSLQIVSDSNNETRLKQVRYRLMIEEWRRNFNFDSVECTITELEELQKQIKLFSAKLDHIIKYKKLEEGYKK